MMLDLSLLMSLPNLRNHLNLKTQKLQEMKVGKLKKNYIVPRIEITSKA